jgi:hypothetical protein
LINAGVKSAAIVQQVRLEVSLVPSAAFKRQEMTWIAKQHNKTSQRGFFEGLTED